MRKVIREDVMRLVSEKSIESNRFNLSTYEYDDKNDVKLRDRNSNLVLRQLLTSASLVKVYLVDNKSLAYLDDFQRATKKRNCYDVILSKDDSNILDLLFSGDFDEDNDEASRGSIVIEVDFNNVDWTSLFSTCFDPGYIMSLEYIMTNSALTYSKKQAKNTSDKVVVVLPELGVDIIAMFSCESNIKHLISMAYRNSKLSKSFQSTYCE